MARVQPGIDGVHRFFRLVAKNWAVCYFGFSILLVAFASGVVVAKTRIFPYSILAGAWDSARDWRENWRSYLRLRPDQVIGKARFDGSGVTVHVPDKAIEGVNLLTGFSDGSHGAFLVDMSGDV